jgi:hypothetical protein
MTGLDKSMLTFLTLSTLCFAEPGPPAQHNPDVEAVDETAAEMGTLVIDARVPAEVLIDGHKVVQLFTSATVDLNVAPGKRRLRVYVNGSPQEHPIEILPTGATLVIIGRTGITTGQRDALPPTDASAIAQVRFRAAGDVASQVRIDGKILRVQPEEISPIELVSGRHDISIRSLDGTAIWAKGVLTLDGGDVVIQIAEGRLPEVAGDGHFTAHGG